MKWFFAYRYLIAHKSHSVINVITALSVVSVAVPLAAMIILMSVFNGFENLIRQMYGRSDADIEILQRSDTAAASILAIDEANLDRVCRIEGIEAAAFIIEHEMLLRYDEAFTLVDVRGVQSNYAEIVPHAASEQKPLEWGEIDRTIIDNYTAYSLGITTISDCRLTLQTLGTGDIGSILPLRGIRSATLQIADVRSMPEREQHIAIVPLRTMQHLYNTDRATAIICRISPDADIDDVRQHLREAAGDDVTIRTRDEKNALFYAIMRYEKWAIFFVALLVLIIASMSIIGSVIMLITEKQHERITLRSIGCDNAFIRNIFVCEGLLIAAVGGLIGTILGIGAIALQHFFGIIKLPEGGFVIENYPVELSWADIAVCYAAFTLVALAASYMATRKMIKNSTLCNE